MSVVLMELLLELLFEHHLHAVDSISRTPLGQRRSTSCVLFLLEGIAAQIQGPVDVILMRFEYVRIHQMAPLPVRP